MATTVNFSNLKLAIRLTLTDHMQCWMQISYLSKYPLEGGLLSFSLVSLETGDEAEEKLSLGSMKLIFLTFKHIHLLSVGDFFLFQSSDY